MGTAHVATIHWWPREVDRRTFQFGIFVLPAVPLGAKPQIIAVTDKVQKEKGPYGESQDRRKRSTKLFPETGEIIARDIVQECTQTGYGMTTGCHPGIWRVRESMPLLYDTDVNEDGRIAHRAGEQQVDAEGTGLWRPANPEEAKAMWEEDEEYNRKADAAYAEMLINDANGKKEELWKFITPLTRAAAAHYKITTLWNTKAGALERTPCPKCGEQIIKGVPYCRHCGRTVDVAKAMLIEEQEKNILLRLGKRPATVTPEPVHAT